MRAATVLNVLERRYLHVEEKRTATRWVFFREFRIGTGYNRNRRDGGPSIEQRIDAFAMSCWPSDGFERHSIEVKVGRADWRKEIRSPIKRMAAYRICNRFYFAVPEGLVEPDEVPIDCGLIVVRGREAVTLVKAPYHESDAPHWPFVASLARRAAWVEKGLRQDEDV